MKHFIKHSIIFCALLFRGLSSNAQLYVPNTNGNAPDESAALHPPYIFAPASNDFNSGGNTTPTLFNITRSWALKTPVTDPSTLNINSTTEAAIATTYSNGWGNTLQTVQRKSNFDHDLIIPGYNRANPTSVSLLPYGYSTTGTGAAHFQPNLFSNQTNYYNNLFPDEGNSAYSTSTTTGFTSTTCSPGAMFTGAGNGPRTDVSSYLTRDIPMWEVDNNGNCYYLDLYPVGALATKTTSFVNHKAREFYDKEGRLICKWVANGLGFLWTHYVYDNMGKLRCVIPPKAAATVSGTGYLDQTVQKNLCYTYTYDDYGLLVQTTTPGKTNPESVIYDTKHRPVLTQSSVQADNGLWSFAIYDNHDRKVLTGVTNSYMSMADWQSIATAAPGSPVGDVTHLANYIAYGFPDDGYQIMQNYTIQDAQVLEIYYYDDYDLDFDLAGRSFIGYNADYLTGASTVFPANSRNTYGLLTGKKVFIPNSPYQRQWISSVYFYDRDGRIIETQTLNPFNDNNQWDIAAVQYDFSGRAILSINDHHAWGNADKQGTKIMTRFNYDPTFNKLTSVAQKTDADANWINLATNAYNDLGQLQQHTMGDVETQKLSYNIRGQLTGINKDYVYNSNCAGCGSMNFGMTLSYDYGFKRSVQDGNISGFIWRGSGASQAAAYGYNYDDAGQLISADYNQLVPLAPPHSVWTNDNVDYTVSGITYDDNGNILTMNQKGSPAGSGPLDIDQLTYTYEPRSNKLTGITDGISANYGMGDFQDWPGLQNGNDYEYDANGNLTFDQNKMISQINYNVFDQPTTINSNNGTITNTYAGDGSLLEKRVEDYNAGTTDIYRYWGPFVYKNDKLQYALNSEGRCRWLQTDNKFEYDYFVRDHLGNVRSTVMAEQGNAIEYLNTNEIALAPLEGRFFDGIAPVRDDNPASAGPSDWKSSRLIGNDPQRRIGPSLLVKVMAGDVFDVSCNSFYEEGTGNDNVSADAGSMLQSIISTLSGNGIGGGYSSGEGVNPADYANNLFSSNNYLNVYDALKEQSTNPALPRAYLNYLVFDENMQIVAEKSGAIQIGAGANAWQTLALNNSIKIDKNGYLSVYVSNEQYHDIYFDNLYIKHTKGRLLQEEQYYPHGLAVNMGSNTPLDNNFQYQGNEKHDELGISMSDFHARQYDVQTGRFWGIDPMNQFASGYIGMGNNPAGLVDPMGTQANGNMASGPDLRKYAIKYTSTDFEWMDGLPHNSMIWGFGLDANGKPSVMAVGAGEYVPGQGLENVHVLNTLPGDVSWNDEMGSFGSYQTPASKSSLYVVGDNCSGYSIEGNFSVVAPKWVAVPQSNTNYFALLSQLIWTAGAAATGMEKYGGEQVLSMYANGIRRGTQGNYQLVGRNYNLFRNAPMTKATEPISVVGKVGKVGGFTLAIISTIVDANGVSIYEDNPNAPGAVSPYKATANLGMNAYGLWVNPFPAMLYFGIDAFYPGGWRGAMKDQINLNQENSFNPYWQIWPLSQKQ